MIYLILHERAAEKAGIPIHLAFNYTSASRIPFGLMQVAEYAFSFDGDKTVYIKDRYADEYQYTSEERLILKLKAVQL